MDKIQVYLHGELLSELLLKPGEIFFAGRSSQSHIILSNERGISRRHIKFFMESDHWVAMATSKYGGLILGSEVVEKVVLKPGLRFQVPPYEFLFEGLGVPDVQKNTTAITSNDEVSIDIVADESFSGTATQNPDSTAIYHAELTAYIKVVNNTLKTEELFRLEGERWLIGRSQECEVAISDSSLSRRHLQLSKEGQKYFVTDLGSSNGTLLNGEALPAQQKSTLSSGDVLTIRQLEFIFELRSGELENKVNNLALLDDEDLFPSEANGTFTPYPSGSHSPSVLKIPPPNRLHQLKLKPLHGIIGALLIVLIYGLLAKSPPANTGSENIASKKTPTELSPDKQKEVADTFNLAKTYYMQRKFVLCVSQLEKLHGVVPFFQNSKELDSLCRQARELEQIELDRKRKEDERVETENLIRKVVDDCKRSVSANTSLIELNVCLQKAIDLDPQNPGIVDLQTQITIREQQAAEKKASAEEFNRKRQQGLTQFLQAQDLMQAGHLKAALNSYKTFLKGDYPGLKQKEYEAKRQIASIENTLEQKLSGMVQNCLNAGEKSDYKSTILACDEALKEDSKNVKAKNQKLKTMNALRKEMMSLYNDAALEESLGNIESAKEKWQKIIHTSVPMEDYYKKAKKKLGKYGLGTDT